MPIDSVGKKKYHKTYQKSRLMDEKGDYDYV